MTDAPGSLPAKVEVGVVGGGIIGLATAFELRSRGLEVVVLDQGLGHESAAYAAAGMLAPAAEADVELPGLAVFRRASHALYPDFVRQVEAVSGVRCGFRREGTLFVSLGPDDEPEIERLYAVLVEQSFAIQRLTARQVLEQEPHVSSQVQGGLWLADDDQIDPRRLLRSLQDALAKQGAPVVRQAKVVEVDPSGGVIGFRDGEVSNRFEIECDHVVLAAGSWTGVGLKSPFEDLPLRPVKGQILRLQGPALLRHVLRTPEVYILPRDDDEYLVGATVEEQGFDARPTAGAVLHLLRHAWQALPSIDDLHLAEVSVGFRPAARDHLPVIGRHEDSRVYIATGHYRNGILLAPATATWLADWICEGRVHPVLRFFDPSRFRTPEAARAHEPDPVSRRAP